MSMKKTLLVYLLVSLTFIYAQQENKDSEFLQIERTLNHYIEGTANGEPERIKKAFHPDLNLYTITEDDSLRVRNGADYISLFKPGKKRNRVGRIIAIDYENNAATAKVEIVVPGGRIFTDYFLLLKYKGQWKIIHKSYTWRPIPGKK